jgi:hypothetical protein
MSRENPNRACGHFEAVYACKPCIEAIRKEMPEFPLQSDRPPVKPGPTSVPWSVADRAWAAYGAQYGRSQSVERLAQRAGFSWGEMDMFYPGWRDATDEWRKYQAENDALKVKLAATEVERDNYLKAFPEYAATGNELREERARTEEARADAEKWKQRWLEMKALPFDGDAQCGYCKGIGACPRCWGRAGITKLEEKLKDIEDSFKATVKGECAPDEKHCSCVPALRLEIERLNALAMKLKTDWDDFDAGVQHGAALARAKGVDLSKLEIASTPVTPVSKSFDPTKGIVGPEYFLSALEKLVNAGMLQKDCPHGAEPHYCDACAFQREKATVAARQEAREVLKKFGRT